MLNCLRYTLCCITLAATITAQAKDCHSMLSPFAKKPRFNSTIKHIDINHLMRFTQSDTLDVSNSDLKDAYIPTIIKFLNNNPDIHRLDMSSNYDLSAQSLTSVASVPSLTDLDISIYSDSGTEEPLSASDMLAFGNNTHLTSLGLQGHAIDDAGAINLAKNHQLQTLEISQNKIGDAGISAILTMPLTWLDIDENKFTPQGLQPIIKNTTLKTLLISSYVDRDAMAAIIAKNNSIDKLYFEYLGNQGLIALGKNSHFKYLHIGGISGDVNGVRGLAENKNLISLDLSSCSCPHATQLNDDSAAVIATITGLKELELDFHHFTSKGLIALSHLPHLKILSLDLNTAIDDAGAIALVKNVPELRFLNLSGTKLTSLGVQALLKLSALTSLWISGIDLTDDIAIALSKKYSLKELKLISDNLNDVTALAFATNCTLNYLDLSGNDFSKFAEKALLNNKHIKKIIVG